MKKTICIVHYNTPELTRAAVLSIRKQGGEDYRVVIFENSFEAALADGKRREARPFAGLLADEQTRKALGDVEIIDNSRGQLVDFDAELAKWPNKKNDSENRLAHFGSAKHMMSVEWLIQHMDGPFMLCDSDILLKRPIDDMFDEAVTACGFIDQGWNNPKTVKRLWPMLCFINAPECR
ncbi:MAG: glycosyltransferase family 2 protein, partial [Prevotella sp.]